MKGKGLKVRVRSGPYPSPIFFRNLYMNLTQFFSTLSALVAALWSVWTWSEAQKKALQAKRDQDAALYTNPFISAMEDLQSRLYNILEEDALSVYKKKYPDNSSFGSPAAIEILYSLGQFFGWSYRTFRFGPYTKDPRVIELIRKIGHVFGNPKEFPGVAFGFRNEERIALGKSVVRSVSESSDRSLFESITYFEFEDDFRNEGSQNSALYRSEPVRSTIAAIDKANIPETLEGRERLAVLQNLLISLLAYIEGLEGFRVAVGKRKKAALLGTHSWVTGMSPLGVHILHQSRGRIRLRILRLKTDQAYAASLESIIKSVKGVTNVRLNLAAASAIVNYVPDIPEGDFSDEIVKAIQKGNSKVSIL